MSEQKQELSFYDDLIKVQSAIDRDWENMKIFIN